MKSKSPGYSRNRGFALIATIMLMVLLAIITVGTLSLSVVTLRSGKQDTAQARARANARMALMIAIGELQKQVGPDQRITANGEILDPDSSNVNHKHWLGVWNSWRAGDGESSQHSTIDGVADEMAPTYLPNRQDYFRAWLVSLDPDEASAISSAKDLDLTGVKYPGSTEQSIQLVGEGSIGESGLPEDFVSARLLNIMDEKAADKVSGRYGWWIGDESQKAKVMYDSYNKPSTLTAAEKIYRGQAPGSTGTKLISGLENLTDQQDIKLDFLPSMKTLDLVSEDPENEPAKKNFHTITPFSKSVLADVREGGLKRDLSTILELPIDRADTADEFMLYEFEDPRFPGDRSHSRVPIQDLSAYYQLYDHEPGFANERREGVQYTSPRLPDSIQMRVPDFDGNSKNRQRILREYTALYRQPVITKMQFLVAVTAQPVTAEERQWVLDRYLQAEADRTKIPLGPLHRSRIVPMRDTDTHKLRLGILPMLTLWNPNNVSMVMDSSQIIRVDAPAFGYRFRKYRTDGTQVDLNWTNLSYAAGNNFGGATTGQASGFPLISLRLARTGTSVIFEPGEVKVFSLPNTTGATLNDDGNVVTLVDSDRSYDVANTWDPFGFFLMPNSTPHGAYEDEAPEAYGFQIGTQRGQSMVFNPNDKISFSIDTENPQAVSTNNWRDGRFVSPTRSMSPKGSAFSMYFLDEGYQSNWRDSLDHIRHFTMACRHGSLNNAIKSQVAQFNLDLLKPGFPGGNAPIAFDNETDAIPGSQIILAADAGEVISMMEFSLSLGCESGTAAAGGFGGGRRITSRPFLHSPLTAAPFIDQNTKEWLYTYGWDWRLGKVNTVEDSIITAMPGTGNGFYGGGYTIESGTTHVLQRQIPILPSISIASLSHAHLGGFSLGYNLSIGSNPDTDTYFKRATGLQNPVGGEYQRTTAHGQGGLAPHVTQAIGNSYAHPNIPANRAYVMKQRLFDADEGPVQAPFVDHSYLANKALWDEYFFSSISPQPAKVELFGGNVRTAKQVADEFFFGDGTEMLPNRRISPYEKNLNQTKLDDLFTEAGDFSNGLADKIAAHLLVDGAFNINSTSVDAWKVLFSSLRGKPVAYLAAGKVPSESMEADKTPVGSGMLPNAVPISSADITSANQPPEQWKTGRVLTDEEIEELAVAMVRQVKLRGPFLSMSDFVNRRLEGDDTPDKSLRSLKGALQAALDDESVSINANFRTAGRTLDTETNGIPFTYQDAAKGPIAYGSMAYVDQADVLSGFAEQLTPRGDTFIIRTYGDAIDARGAVVARAWCEAVVQRLPEYVNPADEAHLKHADPALSKESKDFGRKIQLVSFRWINPNEI